MHNRQQSALAELTRLQRISEDEVELILRHEPPNQHTFTFLCPVCSKTLRAEVKTTGRQGRCPACEMLFNVPSPS